MTTPCSPSPLLDVLICTFGPDGIRRVAEMNLPEVDGVRYVVSWQMPTEGWETPEPLRRPDVEIFPSASRGLGRNRNAAIALASASLCLVADDDLRYTSRQLRSVIETFQSHPEVDLALFRYTEAAPDGTPAHPGKKYPAEECDCSHRLPKGYCPASVEIAFRCLSVAGRVRFPDNLGVGTPYPSAEENFFLLRCRRAGLRCRFFPTDIALHRGLTTGSRPATPGVMQAEGAYLRSAYPLTGLPRVALFAWRNARMGRMGLLAGFFNTLRGFFGLRASR